MVNKKYPSQEFLYVLLFHIVAPHCKIMEMKTATPRILPHFPTTSELFLLKMMRQWDISIIDTPNIHCVKRVHIRSYSGPHFSHIFPHSDWIRRDTEYLSIFSPNAGKCGKNVDQNNSEYFHFVCSGNQGLC